MRTTSRTAFTLIELLVVIAIIAVLCSMLFGALAKAKESGQSAVCKSNLKQLALGIHLYLQDHGRYPAAILNAPGGGSSARSRTSLQRAARRSAHWCAC